MEHLLFLTCVHYATTMTWVNFCLLLRLLFVVLIRGLTALDASLGSFKCESCYSYSTTSPCKLVNRTSWCCAKIQHLFTPRMATSALRAGFLLKSFSAFVSIEVTVICRHNSNFLYLFSFFFFLLLDRPHWRRDKVSSKCVWCAHKQHLAPHLLANRLSYAQYNSCNVATYFAEDTQKFNFVLQMKETR